MTRFYLVRHAIHEGFGSILTGRTGNAFLTAQGHGQAAALAELMARFPIEHIYTSPLERARQTAVVLGDRLGLTPAVRERLNEIDFGEWAGRSFSDIAGDPRWRAWNDFRSSVCAPRGELMLEAQARIVAEIEHLQREHPSVHVALVSHGDIIKAALAHYLGVPLDLFQRIEIGPASVSIMQLMAHGPLILQLNRTMDGVAAAGLHPGPAAH